MEKQGITDIAITEDWLTNDELPICLLKTLPPEVEHYSKDISRPENIKLLRKLFESGKGSRLEQVSLKNPCLILATELAFSSQDYSEIKSIVEKGTCRFIFISGFGFTFGRDLNKLVKNENVIGCWDDTLAEDARYNCGWIWLKDNGKLQCFIFLKTFIDQTHETPYGISEGKKIVRIQGPDLVIFPLICSEVVCNRANSPKETILQSLNSKKPNVSQKILITVSSYEPNPSHPAWQAGIGNLLNNNHNIRLLLTNCGLPIPTEDETKDKWRCLSGAYQKIGTMKDPLPLLPHLRFVKDNQFEGLALRNSNYGIAAGKLVWTNSGTDGKYLMTINFRDAWKGENLEMYECTAAQEELLRTIDRFKGVTIELGEFKGKAIAKNFEDEIEVMKSEFAAFDLADKETQALELLRKCLYGIEANVEINSDKFSEDLSKSFCRALMSLLIIKRSLNLNFPKEKIDYGQILSSLFDQEILVWKSPNKKSVKMISMLQQLAGDGGSAKVLTVVGGGNGVGLNPDSHRIKSNRLTDISAGSRSNEQLITKTRDKVIYWQNMGQLEDVYSAKTEIEELKSEIHSLFEKINK